MKSILTRTRQLKVQAVNQMASWLGGCVHCGSHDRCRISARLCQVCFDQLSGFNTHRCSCCATRLTTEDSHCLDCLQNPPAFNRTQAFADYGGALQHMILAYKFHHQLKFAPLLADFLNVLLSQIPKDAHIIPIPQIPETTQSRGFIPLWHMLKQTNTHALLAANDLIRLHHKQLQVSATAEQRRKQIKGAFAATCDFTNRHIVLIDDVYTTGSTLNEAAKTCRDAGAKNIECLVLARGKWVK